MARKPPNRTSANLSPDEKRAAIPRLESRVAELKALDVTSISRTDDPTVQGLAARITSTLSDIYGAGSLDFTRLREAASLYRSVAVLSLSGRRQGPNPLEMREGIDRGRHRSIALLEGELQSLRESVQHQGPTSARAADARADGRRPSTPNTDVFIVHGHDDPAKLEVARLIERAGLRAIILHELPSADRTIIEKFEDHGGSASFAVVLLTPDDVGGPDRDHLRSRARQNVIGEMFWFAAKLGRSHVCALKKGDVEVPSDFAGVVYIDMDDRGAWKSGLLRELSNAGYTVDWPKALA
jgi:predicted nucleotide-binding protein